jgi:hypothetical protein
MTNDEIARLLRLIREAGLEGEIRLELWLSPEYKSQHSFVGERGQITPSNIGEWFRSYSAVCVALGRIAEAEHASVFYAAVELDSMERYAEQWRSIAADIHAVFSGRVSIVESTGIFLGAENCGQGQFTDLVGQFWDAFDFIAMDVYPADCRALETQSDQRFSVVIERFASEVRRAFDYYRAKYPGKRIEFGEMASNNVNGDLVIGLPDDICASPNYTQDLQEMSDAWAAFLIGASAVGADGIAVWSISPTSERSTFVANYWLNNTPALNVIEACLGGKRAAATQSLAISPLFGFDWEQLPPVLSYSTTPNVESNALPSGGSWTGGKWEYWGQPGCKVKAVKAAIYDDAVVFHVDLYEPDSLGHYRYIVTFRPWSSSEPKTFYVWLDPGASSVSAAVEANGVWTDFWSSTDIWSSTGDEFAAGYSTVSAVIRNELFSGYITPATLLRSAVTLQIDYVATCEYDVFSFPGQSSPPTDRSGQKFLVP